MELNEPRARLLCMRRNPSRDFFLGYAEFFEFGWHVPCDAAKVISPQIYDIANMFERALPVMFAIAFPNALDETHIDEVRM